ncbi:MAG: metalloregulator ArsR/SmtB family transcription factor [Planctomycetia bacterium]
MVLEEPRSRCFHLLGDPVRWRLLRLLAREALSVGEATAVLGLAQSGVSRHLGLLKGAGLVLEERRGAQARLALPAQAPAGLAALWPALRAELEAAPDPHGDDARLSEVLAARDERGEPEPGSTLAEPGRSWAAWAHALAWLVPAQDVVQLGAGSGALSLELARFARRLVAVEPDAGRAAQARARLAGVACAQVLEAALAGVPQPAASADLVVLAQALAALEDPAPVLAEAARLLRPGGRLLVLDLLPHGEAWVRERLGHRRQGTRPEQLRAWLTGAGLLPTRIEAAQRRRSTPFVVLLGAASKPQDPSHA